MPLRISPMDWLQKSQSLYMTLPRPLRTSIESACQRMAPESWVRHIPALQRRLEKEYASLLQEITPQLKPYRDTFPTHGTLPHEGLSHASILAEMRELASRETAWEKGYASGAVYHGDPAHTAFLQEIYGLFSETNPLHTDLWPSLAKFESEIVAMTSHMLGGDAQSCGTVTSGGSESILLAMKTYRDWGRKVKGIRHPEILLPDSAHVAFDKAGEYFSIKMIRIPVTSDCRADVRRTKRGITRNTVCIVGSAPSFPHGVIDPIEALSELAYARGIGFHTDACLGGFLLPWAPEKFQIPAFDLRLRGVTSMSADTHKFGYASKGTSVVLYRNRDWLHHQYFVSTQWPGGLYYSPTLAGSRPGALIAQCWAAMVSMGEAGYRTAATDILETGAWLREALTAIPEIQLLGEALWVLAFTTRTLPIYSVLQAMTHRGWSLNGLHKPPCVHICLTLRHTQPGVKERFLTDLHASLEEVKQQGPQTEGMAPVYGLAATLPIRGVVGELLKRYLDVIHGL